VGRYKKIQLTDGIISGKFRADRITEALETIDYPHHEIHSGSSYSICITTDDLDTNPLRINFSTPAGNKYAHMFVTAYSSGQAELTLREAYTGGGANGTTLTPFNRNRNSANTSMLISTHGTPAAGIMTQGADAATGGNVLLTEEFGAGKDKQSGESRNENEWVLAENTLYQMSLLSTTNLIVATLTLNWYEHTSKNI
jgi:hypothetical protein